MTNKNQTENSRRTFLKKSSVIGMGVILGVDAIDDSIAAPAIQPGLSIATFDIDATPPIGSTLAYDPMENDWDLGLRAKGAVLVGAGKPIVMCAIDWIGIANESQDVFKQTLADAVLTDPKRVVVHTLHQHDAPGCDFSAEKALKEMGMEPGRFESSFAREFLTRLGKAAKDSLSGLRPVTDISIGKAPVDEVASNRRIVKNGKVEATRFTACRDVALRNEPEGLIDPDVTSIGFWDGEKPVAIMTFYATHPQSYYRTKTANPDFPGVARFYRQLAIPDALHIHFAGAGGNIGAGKYNDGSPENRMILAGRLANGMERAWKNSVKMAVTAGDVAWKTEPVSLPVANEFIRQVEKALETSDKQFISSNISKMIWAKNTRTGKTIDLACLRVGKARVLFVPGELFVEYQLAAKAFRPDLAVSVAAYGEYGPSYIGVKEAYSQGGYEIEVSPVLPDVEAVLMNAIRKLLT